MEMKPASSIGTHVSEGREGTIRGKGGVEVDTIRGGKERTGSREAKSARTRVYRTGGGDSGPLVTNGAIYRHMLRQTQALALQAHLCGPGGWGKALPRYRESDGRCTDKLLPHRR